MAKKEKKGKKDKAAEEINGGTSASSPLDAIEAVRSAIERTFAASSEGAQATKDRAGGIVAEVATAANRVRELVDDFRVIEEIKGLRRELAALNARVATLEAGAA